MKMAWQLFLLAGISVSVHAASTINAVNRHACAANLGWINCLADTNNGAVIGEYVCSGYLYSANCGWINLGNGSPTNGIHYLNLSAGDYGVNLDAYGNLYGYAYGANIGWINFEGNGSPKVDLLTGKMSGYAYSANCGWISLSNAAAFVQTDAIQKGVDSNNDGIPDAWELQYFGTIAIDVNADPDGDGISNLNEYLAGTDPTTPRSYFKITGYAFAPGGTNAALTWTSQSTRYYYLQSALNLDAGSWTDSGLGLIPAAGSTTSRSYNATNAALRFYRVQAVRPLMP